MYIKCNLCKTSDYFNIYFMKYLKSFNEANWSVPVPKIDLDDWEDFKELIQSEVLDEWGISQDLVSESAIRAITALPGKSGNLLLEPELHIRINEYFNNSEPVDIIQSCRNLHKQVYQMTGKFISVNWSSQQINIMLDSYPNHWSILSDFNLQEVKSDNTMDDKGGGVCDLETALGIIDYLNSFYRFCYDSDKELFIKCYELMISKDDYKIVFSLSLFRDLRYHQKVCFKFCLDGKWNENTPIYIIDTSHIESPYIRIRLGSYNWKQLTRDSDILAFLKSY